MTGTHPGCETRAFEKELITHIPYLRKYASSLVKPPLNADDLVQDTLLKAIDYQHTFKPGGNMRAWLSTVMHNDFCTSYKRQSRAPQLADNGTLERMMIDQFGASPFGEQKAEAFLDLRQTLLAMLLLPPDQLNALVAVAVAGFGYEETALMFDCAVGTVKSRVSRARRTLGILQQKSRHLEQVDVRFFLQTVSDSAPDSPFDYLSTAYRLLYLPLVSGRISA